MSLVDAYAKSSSKKRRNWRILVALVLALMGTASVLWGTHHLLIMTEVPSCAFPVEEIQEMEAKDEDNNDQLFEANDELHPAQESGGFGQIRVEITGAINQPGLYWLSYESRVADLIEIAGGPTDEADLEKIHQTFNMAQKLKDEQSISLPYQEEAEIEELLHKYCLELNKSEKSSSTQREVEEKDEAKAADETNVVSNQSSGCVSINGASSEQLQTLDGVGEKTAELIIGGRPYYKLSELTEVKGIGDATLEKLEEHICL